MAVVNLMVPTCKFRTTRETITHRRSRRHRNNLLPQTWTGKLGWQPPRQSTETLRYTFLPKEGSFKCVNPVIFAQTCHVKTELEECLGVTDIYCTLLFVFISIPSLRHSVSNKPTCKKNNIIPCLAGIQVRNVPTYLGFNRAKMSLIPSLQCFKGDFISLSILVT